MLSLPSSPLSGWPHRSPWPSWPHLKPECKLHLNPVLHHNQSLIHCRACSSSDGSNGSRGDGNKESGSEHEKEKEKEKVSFSLGDGFDLEAEVSRMLEDTESQALIQDLNAAVERVAKAKKDLDALEELRLRAEINENNQAADSMVIIPILSYHAILSLTFICVYV